MAQPHQHRPCAVPGVYTRTTEDGGWSVGIERGLDSFGGHSEQHSAERTVASSISLVKASFLSSIFFSSFLAEFGRRPNKLFLLLFLSALPPSSSLAHFYKVLLLDPLQPTIIARLTPDASPPPPLPRDRPSDQASNQPAPTVDFAARLHPRGKFYLSRPL